MPENNEMEEKARFDGVVVRVLGPTFAPGKPEPPDEGCWLRKLLDRRDMMGFLKTGERYWYSSDWYGSERRKNPA